MKLCFCPLKKSWGVATQRPLGKFLNSDPTKTREKDIHHWQSSPSPISTWPPKILVWKILFQRAEEDLPILYTRAVCRIVVWSLLKNLIIWPGLILRHLWYPSFVWILFMNFETVNYCFFDGFWLSFVFQEKAHRVGGIKHKRLVNLIGYCCDGDERLLVAEFMPNDTLARHLFYRMFFYFYIIYWWFYLTLLSFRWF